MKKGILGAGLVFVCGCVLAAEPGLTAIVTVDPMAEVGPVKIMHAVNNGPNIAPVLGDQMIGNFTEYKAAKIPYARLHDSIGCCAGGAHCVDVNAVFPDFDADENDPKNYDFVFTDHYLDTIRRAGTQIFFRLGQTIEHGPKKYGVLPPKDYAKWARVCEHIVRHYNEGWAWGVDQALTTKNIAWSNQFNIVYWEIWNEADLDVSDDPAKLPTGPRCWGGTVTNFFEFYTIAAKHLKARFPDLKIGGPAVCGREDWSARFLAYCRDHQAPLDFFSWHIYSEEPAQLAEKSVRIRKLMDNTGFTKAESILDEYNYVKGWTDDWMYSLEVESGRFNQKSAAYIAGSFIDCQYAPVDMLMFYDAKARSGMNNLFDRLTFMPVKGYYPFYAWSKLYALGTQIGCSVSEGRGNKVNAATGTGEAWSGKKRGGDAKGQVRAVAARGASGKMAVFIARYSCDDDTTDIGKVWISVPGADWSGARCHLTDAWRTHTEIPLEADASGAAFLKMAPNSFALVEW